MTSLPVTILLFLPVFLAVNIAAAIPGRADLKDAVRVGMRHFLYGTVIIAAGTVLLHLLMVWLLDREPLW